MRANHSAGGLLRFASIFFSSTDLNISNSLAVYIVALDKVIHTCGVGVNNGLGMVGQVILWWWFGVDEENSVNNVILDDKGTIHSSSMTCHSVYSQFTVWRFPFHFFFFWFILPIPSLTTLITNLMGRSMTWHLPGGMKSNWSLSLTAVCVPLLAVSFDLDILCAQFAQIATMKTATVLTLVMQNLFFFTNQLLKF